MYADEYNDYFAPLWSNNWRMTWNANRGYRKMLALEHDTFEAKGYYCPSAPDYVYADNQWGANYGSNNVGQVFGVRSSFGGKHDVISAHRVSVKSPPMKVQMIDAVHPEAPAVWGAVNPDIRWQTSGDRAPYMGGHYTAAYRHNGGEGANGLRFDGHVEYLGTEEALPDKPIRDMMWLIKSGPED
jgi:prepilin-type processing-associated H-X9-DG protein